MEKKDKDIFKRLSKIGQDGRERNVSSAAALAAAVQGQQQQQHAPGQIAGYVVQVQGFQQETPQGIIMKVYQKMIKPRLEVRFDICSWDVCSPDMLSAQLHIRCASQRQARHVVATLRESPHGCVQGTYVELYTNLQKTQTQTYRSRR